MKGFGSPCCYACRGAFPDGATRHIGGKNASLESVFRKLQQQTGINFVYTRTELQAAKPVTLDVNNAPLEQALDVTFEGQPLSWARQGSTLSLRRRL